jgi:three-Cys-motif partner protein
MMQTNPYLEPVADGLQTRDSGAWVAEKLDYLRRYVDVFETSMRKKWPRRAYIDLFSGPGKCEDRATGQIYLGSPLVALTARYPFTHYYFVDSDQSAMAALERRCSALQVFSRIQFRLGNANAIASSLVNDLLPIPSLNLAFLDPEGLELEWSTVATLATLDRLDLIVHYPQVGLNRYMPAASTHPGNTQVDRFFGDEEWRPIFEAHARGEESFLHRQLMDHYKDRLASLGYAETLRDDEAGLEPAMKNEKGVPLYRLLLASKHSLGIDFWRKITGKDVHGQRRLL